MEAQAAEDKPLMSISDEATEWEDRLPHPDRNAEEQITDAEFQQVVDEHLGKLSDIERTVLVLYHQEERTYEQISLALGLPLGTVRTHLHRGRKRLRESLLAAKNTRRGRDVQSVNGIDETGDRDDAFERRLDGALAAAPLVSISPEFARRIAAQVPSQLVVPVRSPGYARRSAIVCAAGLLIVVLLLAPRAVSGATLFSAIEWIFCAQLSLLALFSISSWSPWRLRG